MRLLERAWRDSPGEEPHGVDRSHHLLRAPLEWDGLPTGDFEARRLTDAQRQMLLALRCREQVTLVPVGARQVAPAAKGVAVHELTITAALRHGDVRVDGPGNYGITNHGLRALLQLR